MVQPEIRTPLITRYANKKTALGPVTETGCPRRFPLAALLHLGAGLRLLAWEEKGITAGRDAGLPPAGDVLRAAARALAGHPVPDPHLQARVLGVFANHFAWDGPDLLGADALVGPLDVDEDAAAEAVAAFLWAATRPRTPTPED